MGTTLTDPIDQPVIPYQAVTHVFFEIPHKSNGDGTALVYDTDLINVKYRVSTYDANFWIETTAQDGESWASLPSIVRSELKTVYDRMVNDAKSKGLIGPGTDDPLPV